MKLYIINKYLAAISGLFLILFLTGHLAGNLQLLIPEASGAQKQFNEYAEFMSTNPIVKVLSILTYISIVLHICVTTYLSLDARRKRDSRYKVVKSKANTISSRYMGVLGTVILAFIVIHLSNFWYKAKFTDEIMKDSFGKKDIYTMVVDKFKNIEHVIIYVLAMGAIFFHTLHGFSSSFQSLGVVSSKTRKYFQIAGMLYSLLIPFLFALIPIYIFAGLHK